MRKQHLKIFAFIFMLSLIWQLCIVKKTYSYDEVSKKNVLILNSYRNGMAWTDDQVDAIKTKLRASGLNLDISVEYMDWKRYPSDEMLENVFRTLKSKYSGLKIDLIMCTDDAALKFALDYRSEILSNAPIVFSGVNEDGLSLLLPGHTNVTGVLEKIEPQKTVELALGLFPNLKKVYVIFDNTESGKSTGSLSLSEISTIRKDLNVVPITDINSPDIIKTLPKDEKDSIILMTTFYMDKDGTPVDDEYLTRQISQSTHIPVFHLYDFSADDGVVGGCMVSGKLTGEEAARLALLILQGKSASELPISSENTSENIFDHNQLDKFRVPDSSIPKGSIILNRHLTFFETYRTLVYEVSSFILVLIAFICMLLFYLSKIRKIQAKLQVNNKQLLHLSEELSSANEELQAQYDELCVTQDNLIQSEERFRFIVDSTNDGIWDWDLDTNKIVFTDKWYEMLGYDTVPYYDAEAWLSLIHPKDLDTVNLSREIHIKNLTDNYECEYRIKARSGEYKWFHTRGKVLVNEQGMPFRLIGSHMDLTELKEYQQRLHYSAYHDSLTGLYNRLYLYEAIGLRVKELKAEKDLEALLFIDTDNFKLVNDTLGHALGDKLISGVAKRLSRLNYTNKTLLRLGGDEFVLYLKDLENKEQIDESAKEIIRSFHEPFIIDGNTLNITVSVGISIYPYDGDDIDSLLKYADMAMYKAKDHGKNCFYFFNSMMNDEMRTRLTIENHLKSGLENHEFTLYYQPQINVKTGKIDTFEALVRWQSPELGLVSPVNFINIAEETGFITSLGSWILEESCSYAA
ncbi:MAG: ABC transporter substrate binding protein, partial [Bacillota bacterium]|nr:ABC transporter substrate binding protein [Bacillota bacterium]